MALIKTTWSNFAKKVLRAFLDGAGISHLGVVVVDDSGNQAGVAGNPLSVSVVALPAGTSDVRFLDENLVAYGIKHVDNKPRVSAMSYYADIAEGNVPDHEAFYRFGHNEVVAAAWETVYHGSDLRTYLTVAERLQIASDDVEDDGDPAGDGAWTVMLTGLDDDYGMLTETVTMNGVANVLTDASFLRVCDITVITAGATGYNEGTITVSNNADTAILDLMEPQENQSHSACLTVPDGYMAYVVQFTMSESSGKGSEIALWRRVEGGLWTKGQSALLTDDALPLPLSMPLPFSSRTDIEIRARAVLAGANVAAGFEGWIEL